MDLGFLIRPNPVDKLDDNFNPFAKRWKCWNVSSKWSFLKIQNSTILLFAEDVITRELFQCEYLNLNAE